MTARLVLVRHGQSVWNAQNRFTGWVDVPLTATGWQEAASAGEALGKMNFDVAFSSHLQRAILTLQIMLSRSQSTRVPIFESWTDALPREDYALQDDEFPVFLHVQALAERHYGDLQGLNKDAIRERYGDDQYWTWRRGFDTPPPNGESLKDTCERVQPFFEAEIAPRLEQGQQVLISAHGNSLRALTMLLENIPEAEIPNLEIPTGVPILYEMAPGSATQIRNRSSLDSRN